ncbi:MAG: sulfide/dihydroorotate dehydrogenase-like FAD/NAD-binding protein [Muribaculaceae bacterium]|nr:sulfide/dihydroorotate dehydrogenase-like FAD/NAD-binding protein [Muribaculaceae bacterium]
MNEIIDIFQYSARTMSVKINNQMVAKRAEPGNFVMIRFDEHGARLPFAIVETDPEEGTLVIIIHRADGLEKIQSLLRRGNVLPDLLGPLGRPAPIDKNCKVLCCGDGAGFVPLLPIIKALHEQGCEVLSVMSEQSDKTACLSDEIENYSDRVILVSEEKLRETVRKEIRERGIAKLWMSGPTSLMKDLEKIAREEGIAASCILNMVMLDGIGLCGVCRVIVNGERKQTCIDGPVFDAHQVDFDQLLNRQRLFE